MKKERVVKAIAIPMVVLSAAGIGAESAVGDRSDPDVAITDSVKAIEEIQQALAEPEGIARDHAVESSVRNGLLHPTDLVRAEVESFLGHLNRRDIFRGLGHIAVDCLELYGTTGEDPHCAEWFFDEIELSTLSVSERVDYYQKAIIDGSVSLWYGSELGRFAAITKAVGDGIVELEPLILEYYPKLNDSQKRLFPSDEIHPTLALRSGAVDRDDACLLGADRLNRTNSREILNSMESDPGFRAAVFRLVRESCFGSCSREACDSLRETAIKTQKVAQESANKPEQKGTNETSDSLEELADRLLMSTNPE